MLFSAAAVVGLLPASAAAQTNDFYDDGKSYRLEGPFNIGIEGEVESGGAVDIRSLRERRVLVKETLMDGKGNRFVGAYAYSGYSVYDILDRVRIEKNIADDFDNVVDLMVRVENEVGDHVVLSWGEIYYPVRPHGIIIATKVTPITPTKTKEAWPIPGKKRLIVSSDLITERNLEAPVKLTILSASGPFRSQENDKLFSPEIRISRQGGLSTTWSGESGDCKDLEYPVVFYGRGRGIHTVSLFRGPLLKDVLSSFFPTERESLRRGIFVISAPDAYRCVFSYSEIMNRTDQSEVLLIDEGEREGGRWRILSSADFFSDRAVKAVSGIDLSIIE